MRSLDRVLKRRAFPGRPIPSMGLNLLASCYTGVLDSRITFTRASSATRVNSSGVLEVIGNNIPAFDYDPVTLQPRGLGIWEQRTNLVRSSDNFTGAAWGFTSTNGCVVSINQAIAPDGTLSADFISPGTVSSRYYYAQTIGTVAANTAHTYSVFLKNAGQGFAFLSYGKSGAPYTRGGCIVNLTTGATQATTVGTPTSNTNLTATDVGNGWWRVSCTVIFDTTSTDGYIEVGPATSLASVNSTQNGSNGIYVWGAQLEAGSFASPYIPTTTAQVTRAADVAVMTGTNFSSWYNQSEGTFFTEWEQPFANTSSLFRVLSGDSANYPMILNNGGLHWNPSADGDVLFAQATAGIHKLAGSYKQNYAAAAYDSTLGSTDSSVTLSSPTAIKIGAAFSTANRELNGYLRSLRYYNKRLDNAQLQGLTK